MTFLKLLFREDEADIVFRKSFEYSFDRGGFFYRFTIEETISEELGIVKPKLFTEIDVS